MEIAITLAIVAIGGLAILGCVMWKDLKGVRVELDAEKAKVIQLYQLMCKAADSYNLLCEVAKQQAAATTYLDQNVVKKSELQ